MSTEEAPAEKRIIPAPSEEVIPALVKMMGKEVEVMGPGGLRRRGKMTGVPFSTIHLLFDDGLVSKEFEWARGVVLDDDKDNEIPLGQLSGIRVLPTGDQYEQ